jgi:hypothetical protein
MSEGINLLARPFAELMSRPIGNLMGWAQFEGNLFCIYSQGPELGHLRRSDSLT